MNNCRDCSNFVTIAEHGDFVRKCTEGLTTIYEDHECKEYDMLERGCSDCD